MARPRLISDDEILGTVRRAVLDEGPRVSLDVVAARLGVTAPALFKRFGSRSALLVAALKPSRPAFLARLEGAPDDRRFGAQLAELFAEIGTWFSGTVPCMVALKGSGISLEEVDAALEDAPPLVITRALTGWLARAAEAGLAEVADPEAAAVAMLGALQTRAFLSHLLRRKLLPRDLQRDAVRFSTLFVDGLAPRSRGRGLRRLPERRASKTR